MWSEASYKRYESTRSDLYPVIFVAVGRDQIWPGWVSYLVGRVDMLTTTSRLRSVSPR